MASSPGDEPSAEPDWLAKQRANMPEGLALSGRHAAFARKQRHSPTPPHGPLLAGSETEIKSKKQGGKRKRKKEKKEKHPPRRNGRLTTSVGGRLLRFAPLRPGRRAGCTFLFWVWGEERGRGGEGEMGGTGNGGTGGTKKQNKTKEKAGEKVNALRSACAYVRGVIV